MDDVADTVRKLHRRYLEETNKRFAEALARRRGLKRPGSHRSGRSGQRALAGGEQSWFWMPSASISPESWRRNSVALVGR